MTPVQHIEEGNAMKRMIAIAFVFALLIGLCACQKTQDSNDPTQITTIPTQMTATPTQLQPKPTQTQTTDPIPTQTQPTEPADPRIAEMQELFDYKSDYIFYNTALTSVYENPADVDLANLFYNGFRDESDEPTEEELNLLEGIMGPYWQMMDLVRLPTAKMDAVLMDLFGITLEQTNGVGLDRLVYLEETDCYYTAVTGMHYADITVAYVETLLEDFNLIVQYSAPLYGNFMVKLMPIPDGGYQILSNVAIDHLYNETGVWNAIVEYFDQREAYLLGKSTEISNIMPGILPDEASHLAAINSAGVKWLGSDITMEINGCWDSHAEAIVTETVKFRANGAEQTEIVVHRIHAFLSNDGAIIIGSDCYQEVTTGFSSAAYLPPELW